MCISMHTYYKDAAVNLEYTYVEGYRVASYFQGEKFSRIVTDFKEYLLKSKHFKGKIFTNCFRL